MPYKSKEDRASAVRRHYEANKEDVNKSKVIKRILEGKIPQAKTLERFNITEDMVNEMRREVDLEPIKVKTTPKTTTTSPDPKDLPMPSAKLLGKKPMGDLDNENSYFPVFSRLFKKAKCSEDDVIGCLKSNELLDFINKTYENPNTKHTYLTAVLKTIDDNDLGKDLHEKWLSVWEEAKQEKETFNIQEQLTKEVPKFSSIKKRIIKEFPEDSQEVLMIKLYDEITPRNDFDTLTFNTEDPNHIDLKKGTITLKDFKKTNQKYKPIENYKLSKKFMEFIRTHHGDRDKVFTKQMRSIFKKTKTGIDEIRHAKISETLKGEKIQDEKTREELREKMLHSSATQLRYIRKLKD